MLDLETMFLKELIYMNLAAMQFSMVGIAAHAEDMVKGVELIRTDRVAACLC
jgi:hypothetical protein